MLKFDAQGHLKGCFVIDAIAGVADFVGSLFTGAGAAGAGAAATGAEAAGAAGAGAIDAAALGAPALGVAAPSTISGLTAAGVGGGDLASTLGLGSASAVLGGDLAAAAPTLAPSAIPAAFQTAPLETSTLAPLSATPASTLAPVSAGTAGGGTLSATGAAAPASVAGVGPDVTQAGFYNPQIAETGSNLLGPVGSPLTQAGNLPGAVGNGAATGASSNLAGAATAAPTSVDKLGTAISSFADNPSFAGAGTVAKDVGSVLYNNPTAALGGLAAGFDILKGNQTPKGYKQIGQEAQALATQARQNENYLASGTLPPGLQETINAAANASAAQIRYQYASRGMTGSSAEAQDIQAAMTQKVAQMSDLAMKLYSQGVSESEISSQLYGTLMQESIAQDQEFGNALSSLLYAMSGGTPRAPAGA